MPGQTTHFGIPFPYVGETADAGSFQAAAVAMDAAFSTVDVTRQRLLHRPSVYAQNITLVTLTSGTATAFNFNQNLWANPASFHSTSSNTDQFVIPEDGAYLATCNVVGYPACNRVITGIQQNGSTVAQHSEGPNNTVSNGSGVGCTTLIIASAGDVLRGTGRFDGTGTTTVHVAFQVFKMSDQ